MNWQQYSVGSIFLGLSVGAAWADDAQLMRCGQIQDNIARLACFDQIINAQLPSQQVIEIADVAQEQKPAVDLSKSWATVVDSSEKSQLVLDKSSMETSDLNPTQQSGAEFRTYTALSQAWDLDSNDIDGTFTVRPYKRMYLMPAWYNSKPNYTPNTPTQGSVVQLEDKNKNIEAKMQLSFKTKVFEDLFSTRADVWFGYTQTSQWQVYNNQMSSPFRNTDYEPEIFITQPVSARLPFGGQLRMLGAGLNHQSNGQSDPLSRSWNRVIAMAGMEWGNLTVSPKLWWRIPEKKENDDNPDLVDYMGYGEVHFDYRLGNRKSIGALVRLNPKTGKSGMQLDYSFPINKRLRGFVQMYDGYGMNLLDYNHKHRSVGFGIMLNDWNGL